MERERREKRDRGASTGTRRKIVCAQGFQGVHPRVGPAPDTTLTPPFYGVVKYRSPFLALSYHVSLASLSSSLPTLTLPPAPFSSAPLADCVPSSASALRTLVLSFPPPSRRPLPSSLLPKGWSTLAFTLRHALLRFGAWHKRKKRVALHPRSENFLRLRRLLVSVSALIPRRF